MIVPIIRRITALAAATTVGLAGLAATPALAKPPATTDLRVIAFNDFHGNLEPPAGSSGRVILPDGSTVDAGGAAFLAAHVKQLRTKNSIVVSAGDNIGASPLASALFHDEPTIELLNDIGVDASVVGNHEFDEGYKELQRIQFGGCHPTDGCQFRPKFTGAKFPFLGANVYTDRGLPALLPFSIEVRDGIPVGIIGVTLKDLPSVVTPEAIKGLKFGDEIQAIDRTANLLDFFGVKSLIVAMHQGDSTEGGGPDDCRTAGGAARTIVEQASPKVDAFFTGHSHQQYNCLVEDRNHQLRPMIQGSSFGRLLSVVDFKIDRRTKDVIRTETKSHNEIVTRTVTPDPTVAALVKDATTKSGPIANRPVGAITADLLRAQNAAGESPLGDVLADGQLAATTANNAVIAITNPGGIRADVLFPSSPAGEGNGVVTYGEAFTVQPFSNFMQTITLTGANLKNVLEQQWQPNNIVRILQISSSLHYTWSASAPTGSKISNITVNGVPVDPNASYRVSVNNFLAAGGDGFAELTKGTSLVGGPVDLDAFTAYLTAHPNLAPPATDRITKVG
jgi:5'-nucleotidase